MVANGGIFDGIFRLRSAISARRSALILLSATALLHGCTSLPKKAAATNFAETRSCQSGEVTIDTQFLSAAAQDCQVVGAREITLSIQPEDAPPINCSAWYAFRITADKPGPVIVNLNYDNCGHRYPPKLSSGKNREWKLLPQDSVQVEEKDGVRQARITLDVGTEPVLISAQEIVSTASYKRWTSKISKSPAVTTGTLGYSAEKYPIASLSIKAPGKRSREQVVLVGRQHPPEISGALVMFPFIETLLEDSDLAKKYRERFETIAVPMLNPDGVVRGYWRHNTGGVDLNRDWGPFTQPETKLMDGLLKAIAADPERRLRFLVDFHSTRHDVFYTIPDDFPTDPPGFLKQWLDRYAERMPGYEIRRQSSRNLTQTNSKNYVYRTYGVPVVTFEIGDETDRTLIKRIGRESAIAMMETLLATKPPQR